jgi:hypothetical protein
MSLTIHQLHVTARTQTPLELDAQSGAAIRGALFSGLWNRFCTNKAAPSCATCPLVRVCPVASLVAPLRDEGQKGSAQQPRPYVIQPPTSVPHRYAAGDTLTFGLGLFGPAADLFPYLVLAAQTLEQHGLGRTLPELGYRRGTVCIEQIDAVSPFTGERLPLAIQGQPQVQSPGLPITAADVRAYAAQLPTDQVTLHLHTPLRLIDDNRLVKRLTLRPLVQRLLRRLGDLSIAYGSGDLELDFATLLDQAAHAAVVADQTRWLDVVSYSSRTRRRTPIGGLVGQVTFAGNLAPLREILAWGMLVHVGRNVVKGDGWYTLAA